MSDFDRIREEGERISREEGYKVLLAEIAARDAEIERLRLTAVEIAEIELLARLAWQDADDASFVLDIDRARACERRAAPCVACWSGWEESNDRRGHPRHR